MKQVIIIGGGVAGLITAIHLAERGLSPLLLEADPDVMGGRLKNGPVVEIEHQGKVWAFPGEHGVHGIWAPYLNLVYTLSRLDILPNLIPAREEVWIFGRKQKIRRAAIGSAIRYSQIPAPFHYLHLFARPRFLNILTLRDVASLFRVLASLLSAMSIDPIAEFKSLKGMSLADFTAGWSPTLRSFFAGLARNALAGHPEDVPAAGFIAFLRFYTLLRRDAWQFFYLPGPGGQCVVSPLAETAQRLGTEIMMGARAMALQSSRGAGVQGGRGAGEQGSRGARGQGSEGAGENRKSKIQNRKSWQVVYEVGGEQKTVAAERVVLALDAPATKKLLGESAATREIAKDLWFPTGVPTAIIRLWFTSKSKSIAEAGIFSGDFVMDNFFWLDCLQPAYQVWAQETGGSAVEMHIYGPPELLARPDALLLAQVITDVYRAFPELRGTLLHSELIRNAASHTLFSVGEADTHLGINTPWPNIYACGDWVYHPAPALYLERATTTAIAAANAILSEMALDPWPILPHPKPEWLAGKIEAALRAVRQMMLNRAMRNAERRTKNEE